MINALEIENLSFTPVQNKFFNSDDAARSILRDINLNVEEGTILGITGESGSGKTTLAKLIAGILIPTTGNIKINDNSIPHPVQILFQNSDELINPLRQVEQILFENDRPINRIMEMCELVGIPEKHFIKKAFQLSGGERQRVGLARILLADPKIIILDEPFSAQDPKSQKNLGDLFTNINKQFNLTMICISHDIHTLNKLSNQSVILYGGKIVETGKTGNIFNKPRHPYTKFLLEASEYLLDRKSFGELDSDAREDTACPYYSRCDRKLDRCKTEVDTLKQANETAYCNNPF